jgi:DNA-directed RNA polymerase subunit RPC12/RpoP
MEVTCSKCKKTLKIPDEKIPRDQAVKVACPVCKNKILIDLRDSTWEAPEEAPGVTTTMDFGTQGDGAEEYGEGTSLGFFDENTRLALVLDNDSERKTKIREAVEELGFLFIDSDGTRDAIGKMRFNQFNLIVLAEGFDDQPLEYSPIINSLNHTPMSYRRKTFLALIGDQLQTMDNMMAFAMSANLVIHPEDMDKLPAVLKKGIAENERFYKVFMDCLRETGKD